MVETPGALMKPNPYPPGSEEAAFYDATKTATAAEWSPGMALNMMGGGVAGTGAKASEVALTAGYDPALWHGVSQIKLPKPVSEMSSVLRPVNPAPEVVISPSKLEGSLLMPLIGDRTATAAMLERVNGYQFENPVSLEGGHGYMANNPGMAWAAGKSIAPGIGRVAREGAESGAPVHGVYTAMGERTPDFTHMMSDTLVEMAKHTKITPKGAELFDETMRKISPTFPGIHDPNVAQYLRDAPGAVRNVFAKTMDTAPMQKHGFPSVAEARVAVTDPRLLNEPTGAAGLSISRMDPEGRLGPSGHSTYSTGIKGDYVGGLPASVPKEIMFPDVLGPLSKHADAVAQARVDAGLKPFRPTEDYLMGRMPKGLPKFQEANSKWVDSVSKHLEDRGFTLGSGATDKKMGAILAATDNQPQGVRATYGVGDPTQTGWVFKDVAHPHKLMEKGDWRAVTRATETGEGVANVELPIRSLNATQKSVNADFANALPRGDGKDAPFVIKKNGQYFVQDGHHRLTAAAESGRQTAGVRLVDLDGTTQTQFPLIDIMKKYGIAGAAPAGMGALAAQDYYQGQEQ
jgi:hypothetical protein